MGRSREIDLYGSFLNAHLAFLHRPADLRRRGLDRVRDPRRRVVLAAAGGAISRDRAADHQRLRAISRRQRRGRRRHRGDADRAADQRRREHALHVVEFDGRRQILDPGELRSRHQSRYRAGAGAEPRRHRAAAAAGRRAQYRRHGDQGVARPDDGRAPLFARQVARRAVHDQLRHARSHRPAHPRRRRRFGHGVRQPRLFDAHLARSRSPAIARADRRRCHRGATRPKHSGRLGRARSAAGGASGRVPDRGADARPARQSGGFRFYRRQRDAGRGGAAQRRRRRQAPGARLFVEFLSRSRFRRRARRVPAPRLECAVHRRRRQRTDGASCRSVSRPDSNTTSSTIRPSSSGSRSTR